MFLEFWELQNMGFDIKLGIDSYFNERANKEGKQVIGLESQLFHTELLAGLTKDEAEALLNNVLKNLGKFRANVEKISTAWQAGEMTVVADYINREIGDHPTLIHRLLVERNKNWVPQIEALAKGDKDAIVTVGAGHLAGKQSLVELLEKNGWKVTQQVMLPNEERAKPAL